MSKYLLRKLKAAKTDDERSWIVTENLLESLPTDLATALWAVAIPHWFNTEILTTLCPDLSEQAEDLYQQLQKLPCVEVFAGQGHNVHELTRNQLLDRMSKNDPERFRDLTGKLDLAKLKSPLKAGKSSLKAGKSPLKAGVPFPRVRLPENFVERTNTLNAVKAKLLSVENRTLVVGAMGGLGKSVLAAALVNDLEVQAQFADGILWVTLGQSPDLQTLLGDWIRELDKSREAFRANTLESASRYLHNLLAERQMLLVVDDVWNAAHAEWFRVGGEGCRVLVTTREAQIEGAEYYPLELMSEAEAISLVMKKLGSKWRSVQEVEVKAFAKLLGYLPLALDLATNQVRDGLSWEELRSEFQAERRSVASGIGRRSRALNLLDSSEKWDDLDENAHRKYSLQACFNLSLKRLTPEQLQQFVWLGVLPEDVNFNSRMAEVLWDLKPLQAKRVLIMLRNRSFLTDGVATITNEPTYRVQDLMHDMARSLIEEGILSSEPVSRLKLAHQQFLERYRERASNHRWDGLPNDGYIHRHLTWHLEQANWGDELHALMSMSDAKGRNAWFEACDRLGQPAIFVDDVARGWKIAERGYESERADSIVLQCRYALITATLNSLVENLPIGMMAEFVKYGFWAVEQAWAYVEQMQYEEKIAESIQALAPYLSKSLFQVALEAAREIQDANIRASVLSKLANIDSTYFEEALEAAREIQDANIRASVLSELANIDSTYFEEALAAVRKIQDANIRASALSKLANIDSTYFEEVVVAAREIQDANIRASALSELANIDSTYFEEALAAVRKIQDANIRASALSKLANIDSTYFEEALAAVRKIQDADIRASALSKLANIDSTYFEEALAAVRKIQDADIRASALSELANIDSAYFDVLLESVREIQDDSIQASALSELANIDSAYFEEALQAVREIKDDSIQASALSTLANIDSAYFEEALQAVREIKDDSIQASALSTLAEHSPQGNLSKIYEAILAIVHKPSRAQAISSYITRLSLATLPYSEWQTHLHILAHRKRSDLMQDLVTLYPAILHLGGTAAVRGVVDTMRQVCSQWK